MNEQKERYGKFTKRPVTIEAFQWDGTESGIQRIKAKFPELDTCSKTGHLQKDEVTDWRIRTLEGAMRVSTGDWIIKGIKGEFYPCKPDIFEASYVSASLGEQQAPQWRDIATAPKDGTEFLCRSKEFGCVVVYWDDFCEFPKWSAGFTDEALTPTHWMPLPPPPGEQQPPAEPQGVPEPTWNEPNQEDLNDWFLSLSEGRRKALLDGCIPRWKSRPPPAISRCACSAALA